jgi:pimeloyl-ACP methyl ester carboxylesterase
MPYDESSAPERMLRVADDAIGPRYGSVLSISRAHGFHRIAYTEWGDPRSERVALCAHGLTRQGRDFDYLAIELARRGYRVVCPDLVGRGLSDNLKDPEEYALPQYAMDMTVLMARLGIPSVDWIGTSLGGLIGMTLAGQGRAPIRKLVVNDIGPYVPWLALHRIGWYLRQAPESFPDYASAELHLRTVLAPFGELSDSDWRHLTKYSVARQPNGRYRMLYDPGIARVFRPVLFYNLTLWRYWDAIICPVLLLRGEYSDLLPSDLAWSMTRRGPEVELVEIPGCGHAPALLDEDQIRLVADWVAEEA